MPTKPTAIEHIPTPTDSPAELWLDATAQTIPKGHGVILIIVAPDADGMGRMIGSRSNMDAVTSVGVMKSAAQGLVSRLAEGN